ncbi:STAS domain-containing protein [Hoeflea alexandrii]|uniref:STAS domain-containing protein n=1 Tax=Hoeflea alexandrii TaxID=288436 RepID=UPI0022AFA985|nr:STAS domain-containing protein [Hoeflea alexandrii]MCZ4291488.1 STAS domain-containing protein [Hoeflea alexandrii]
MTEQTDTLHLEGSLTIKTVTETRGKVVAALKNARDGNHLLEIIISEDSNCDLTLPQLLMAAQTTADADGVEIRIRAAEESAFATTLERAGFTGSGVDGSTLRINGDNR